MVGISVGRLGLDVGNSVGGLLVGDAVGAAPMRTPTRPEQTVLE